MKAYRQEVSEIPVNGGTSMEELTSVRDYLELLKTHFEPTAKKVSIEETEDGPALIFSTDSLVGRSEETVYNIWFDMSEDTLPSVNLTVVPFPVIPAEKEKNVIRVAETLNLYGLIGHFSVFGPSRALLMRHAFYIDPEMNFGNLTRLIGNSLALMETDAVPAGKHIGRLLDGKASAEEVIAEISADFGEAGDADE